MKKTMSTEELSEIAQAVATKHGYVHGGASWSSFADFKVQWQRGLGFIDFKIADYLNDASPDILYSLFDTLFYKIKGEEGDCRGSYHDEFLAHILSDEFRAAKRKTFVRRKHFLNGAGDNFDLNCILNALVKEGHIPDEDVLAVWTDRDVPDNVGFSVLFRVVMIPTGLDDREMTEEIIRKLLIHGVSKIRRGVAIMEDTSMEDIIPEPVLSLTADELGVLGRLV